MSFMDRLRVRRLRLDPERSPAHRIGLRPSVTYIRKEDADCCNARRDDDGRLPIGFCSPTCTRRDVGAVNLFVVALGLLLGLVIVVMLMVAEKVDDEGTRVEAVAPAPARDLAETTTTSTTTTTIEVLAERVVAHAKAAATTPTIDTASADISVAIRDGFARFGDGVARQAVDVAECESHLDPGETGDAGERGLFQIHPKYHQDRIARLGFTWDRMYEVGPNIAVAADLYAEQGWAPWTCAR